MKVKTFGYILLLLLSSLGSSTVLVIIKTVLSTPVTPLDIMLFAISDEFKQYITIYKENQAENISLAGRFFKGRGKGKGY